MWIYKQSTGELFYNNSEALDKGYAGAKEHKNDPESQRVLNKGPLPRGLYSIGTAQDHFRLGPLAMPLTPDVNNEMFGRSAFYIHGDSVTNPGNASEGCIILSSPIRKRISIHKDKKLVVVK